MLLLNILLFHLLVALDAACVKQAERTVAKPVIEPKHQPTVSIDLSVLRIC